MAPLHAFSPWDSKITIISTDSQYNLSFNTKGAETKIDSQPISKQSAVSIVQNLCLTRFAIKAVANYKMIYEKVKCLMRDVYKTIKHEDKLRLN